MNDYPKISILTPLYNRNKWLPMMISNIVNLDYEKNKIEWYILDSRDGDEEVKLIPDEMTLKNIQDIIHCYLKYSIDLCKKNKVGLCGSPQMIFVHPHLDYRITAIECGAKRQMHEATMVGTIKYLRSMDYYTRNDEKGEGASLVDGNEKNVVKSECALQMICVCHNTNTCNKDAFEEINIQEAKITGIKLDILKELMDEEVKNGKNNQSKFTIPDQSKPSQPCVP